MGQQDDKEGGDSDDQENKGTDYPEGTDVREIETNLHDEIEGLTQCESIEASPLTSNTDSDLTPEMTVDPKSVESETKPEAEEEEVVINPVIG